LAHVSCEDDLANLLSITLNVDDSMVSFACLINMYHAHGKADEVGATLARQKFIRIFSGQ
jgi:hypothetical protein